MTTEIARFMVALEHTWDAHLDALLTRRDPEAALVDAAREPSVAHLPMMTGARGRAAVTAFYAEELVAHLPEDFVRTRISRTVDRFHLVDEATTSFTHDQELPWLLPGVPATHRRVEVLTITVVEFDRGRIAATRTLWDHATLCDRLGLDGLPGRRQGSRVRSQPRRR